MLMVMIMPLTEVLAEGEGGALNTYRAHTNQFTGMTEQKAIAIAKQHFKGRILAITLTDNIYRIKMLSNAGTVHIIQINATDGTIISTH